MELLSFIIPAHNESFEIGKNLESIFSSARAVGVPFEVIVVNDASTDNTAALARSAGAQVVDVNVRQISRARNAGARQAKGDAFFFVDADTRITPELLKAALKVLNEGAVGGGSQVRFTDPVSWTVLVAMHAFSLVYMDLLHWAAGCFLFARRSAFEAAGGFDETYYAGEEVLLSMALKRQGRFVVLGESVYTSNRKLRTHSTWSLIPFLLRFLRHGRSMFHRRDGLEWWYDGKREDSKGKNDQPKIG